MYRGAIFRENILASQARGSTTNLMESTAIKKPTEFTIEERYQLKGALYDLADRIRKAADTID